MSPPIHAASTAAWQDEAHVIENRRLYREKFAAVTRILRDVTEIGMPDAAFYIWLDTPARRYRVHARLLAEQNVSVLPGSYLAREARGVNPGTQLRAHCAGCFHRRMHRGGAAHRRFYAPTTNLPTETP